MRAKTVFQPAIVFTCLMIAEIRAQCDRPRVGGNRILTPETDKPSYEIGSIAKFKCSVGYEPVDRAASTTITCEGTGWTVLQLECQKKSCGTLREISNGIWQYPEGNQFGAIAEAVCNTGYKVLGDNKRNCRDAGWDGRNPTCEVVKCDPPPGIDNGNVEEEKDEYQYGEVVTYSCMRDFTLFGSKLISCSSTGLFDPPPPKCLKVSCEEPDVPNGFRIEGKSPPYGYKNFVRYKCRDGYIMKGKDYLICGENRWDPPPPECNLIPPPTPPSRPTETTTGVSSSASPPPTPTPFPHGKAWGIGIGVGLAIGALALVLYFRKRKDSLKVPTSNDDMDI
ncbi:membrane cofactor protein-like isoform X2 [Brachyhypopomus gauderio]|uniref:membrane cofactor protein-like isoform X2 n=1 Tax=Brachyhypopomus gauderio TaxID=698409 RepID=UPI004043882C